MTWIVETTETLSKNVKKHSKNSELLSALDAKIRRLEQDPNSVGGKLAGALHGKQSTRLVRKYRLIFQIDENNKKVYLLAIDHRKDAYD